ncbi:MAG: hypothetical protein KDC56_12970 [Flavobacteriaceae bacterium]|nr:hypothetical protein [Flavobacteriaceae bacterium]
MNTLFFLSVLSLASHNPNTMIVAKNIRYIIQYFEVEESLIHKDIGLISSLDNEAIEQLINFLTIEYPGIKIKHYSSDSIKNNLCLNSEHHLFIKIPEGILQTSQGVFKYSFQSRLRNIFGTFEIELKAEDGRVTIVREQFFTTSIGQREF